MRVGKTRGATLGIDSSNWFKHSIGGAIVVVIITEIVTRLFT